MKKGNNTMGKADSPESNAERGSLGWDPPHRWLDLVGMACLRESSAQGCAQKERKKNLAQSLLYFYNQGQV